MEPKPLRSGSCGVELANLCAADDVFRSDTVGLAGVSEGLSEDFVEALSANGTAIGEADSMDKSFSAAFAYGVGVVAGDCEGGGFGGGVHFLFWLGFGLAGVWFFFPHLPLYYPFSPSFARFFFTER